MTSHRTPDAPPARLDAAYHLLDRQILDEDGRCVAKVDDLELIEQDDGRLVVSALLVGPGALGPRIGGRVGGAMAAIWHRLQALEHPLPGRIDIERVTGIGSAVHVAGTGADLDVDGFEQWTERHVVSRLPLVRSRGPQPPGHNAARAPVDPERVRRTVDVLNRSVRDRDGRELGRVSDLRLRTGFVDEGSRWRTRGMEVTDLILNQRALATLLGYERRHDQGPWLLRTLLRRFRPPAHALLPWERAEVSWEEHRVTHRGERLDDYRL
jgi:sporulation protein YlmC with PRC-barrel domain